MNLARAFSKMPLMAILRGVSEELVPDITASLVNVGCNAIEVPFNLNTGVDALERLLQQKQQYFPDLQVGVGTVYHYGQLMFLQESGVKVDFVVTPGVNESVIMQARNLGSEIICGIATPTEAFKAIECGCRYLKLFPAGSLGTDYLKALLQVIPEHVSIIPVGGISPDEIDDWFSNGALAVGIGQHLFAEGDALERFHHKLSSLTQQSTLIRGSL